MFIFINTDGTMFSAKELDGHQPYTFEAEFILEVTGEVVVTKNRARFNQEPLISHDQVFYIHSLDS